MEHIAIDLGSRESQVCIRNEQGKILLERRVLTLGLEGMLAARPPARVIVETSSESLAVADAAVQHGHQVRVVPATLVRALGVGARGIKTDVRDAQVLSEASCRLDLPSVHMPAPLSRERKAMCTCRQSLVRTRTHLVNTTRAFLRTRLVTLSPGAPESLPKRVRERLLKTPQGVPEHVEWLLKSVEALNEQIHLADQRLTSLAKQDATCRRLMSVPGVGPITALRFVSTVDDVKRFPNADKLQSYLGLTPGESTTGFRTQRTRLTKAGPACVRHCLGQAALVLWRIRPNDPMVVWAKAVCGRVGKPKAVVALARKLSRVLYAIWRDGSSYNPNHRRPAPRA
jgi:transposase